MTHETQQGPRNLRQPNGPPATAQIYHGGARNRFSHAHVEQFNRCSNRISQRKRGLTTSSRDTIDARGTQHAPGSSGFPLISTYNFRTARGDSDSALYEAATSSF
ncbi:hypothetical protein RRG08_045775 [Elysia crispata]|uniref:Uncharacterized protein n=1 Tax=Elysia crispata TaxID=231223 RepID=A0AAE1E8H1_9GAST|nr:hypothetical protein RRG08_045775 [Elysia crispata]